ncbi:DUF2269 family protein [Brevibacillus sp. H7]|uniref:DUF2269 family protein n=1 Tax=Brevibacillus sp. H7 TaxID=3349138 RepID=UPI00382612C6
MEALIVILIIVHILSAIAWLGGAIFERAVVVSAVKQARNTRLELSHIILYTRNLGYYGTILLLLAVSGIILALVTGLGFFQVMWLGLKQGILLGAILLFFPVVRPLVQRLQREAVKLEQGERVATEDVRSTFARSRWYFAVLHTAVLVNVLLATVFRGE